MKLEQDPFCGHVFVFRGRRGDLIKVLWWDGDGLCLFAGRFVWPKAESGKSALSRAQLSMLLKASTGAARYAPRRPRWQCRKNKNHSDCLQLVMTLQYPYGKVKPWLPRTRHCRI